MRDGQPTAVREAARKYSVVASASAQDEREALILRAHEELGLRLDYLTEIPDASAEQLKKAALKPVQWSDERREVYEELISEARKRLGVNSK